MNPTTIMSNGMGVESAAILLRWIEEPATRPCALEELIVITSQVGDEYRDTLDLMTEHMLPKFREHGIRYVQVARAGHLEEDGYVILDDTREPTVMYGKGAYKLSDELLMAGTVPQFGGEHICSLKFKAFVIESWIRDNVTGPARHAFGYNADEQSRVAHSEAGIEQRNAKLRIAFGFNADERTRYERAAGYDTPIRQGFYPLVEWGWSRQDCLDYIQRILGVTWRKSACVYCPFAHNKQNQAELAARHQAHPEQVADAMFIERCALALNPRSTLYATKSLIDITVAADNRPAVAQYWDKLQTSEWATYHVRRIYSAKGKARRCVQKLRSFATRAEAVQSIRETAQRHGVPLETKRAVEYLYTARRQDDVYPASESFYVAAPARPETKAHPTVASFEKAWAAYQAQVAPASAVAA